MTFRQIWKFHSDGGSCSGQQHTRGLNVHFLVTPPLPSGVTYLVTTASVCMYGCSLVEIFFTKGFFFGHQIWLDTCSDLKKKFPQRTPLSLSPPPPPVKGKIFDTRFGLIHVQTGKKFFAKNLFSKIFFCKIFLMPIS